MGRKMEDFAGMAYDVKSATAAGNRFVGRGFYDTPISQRPLSRSFQNESSSGTFFFFFGIFCL